MTTAHLDDEALSAAVDGEATAAERGHLASCSVCQARMGSLQAVAHAVGGAVVSPPSPQVERAITSALADWQADPGDDEAMAAVSVGAAAPMRSPMPASSDRLIGDQRPAAPRRPSTPGRRPSRWLVVAAGIAAAIVVVGGVVVAGRGTSQHASSTASPEAAPNLTPPRSPAGAAISGGDLGDQSDSATVAQLIMAALARSTSASRPTAAAPTVLAPTASAPGVAPSSAAAHATPATDCVDQARAAVGASAGSAPTVRFLAPLVWRGQPAVAVVFQGPAGMAGAVMSAPGCSLLAVLPL